MRFAQTTRNEERRSNDETSAKQQQHHDTHIGDKDFCVQRALNAQALQELNTQAISIEILEAWVVSAATAERSRWIIEAAMTEESEKWKFCLPQEVKFGLRKRIRRSRSLEMQPSLMAEERHRPNEPLS